MPKVLLFDIDGVLIRLERWFSETLSPDRYNDPRSILDEFHQGELNRECDRGVRDPLIEIAPFLDRMGWDQRVEDYFSMKYKYESQFIDFDLLNDIQSLRRAGALVFIGSNQDYHRKAFLRTSMRLDEIFTESFFSCDFGHAKPDRAYWELVMAGIGKHDSAIQKEDVLFLDDLASNIESATVFGMATRHIKNRNDVVEVIEKLKKRGLTSSSTRHPIWHVN